MEHDWATYVGLRQIIDYCKTRTVRMTCKNEMLNEICILVRSAKVEIKDNDWQELRSNEVKQL